MRKIFIALFFILTFFSCKDNTIKFEDLNIIYLKDDKNSLSFLVSFQYPKSEKFEATMKVYSQDNKFIWKSKCFDFASSNKSYKVAGRFLLPSLDIDGEGVKIEINYRDNTEIYDYAFMLPQDVNKKEDIEIFNTTFTKKGDSNSFSMDYKDSFKNTDEYAYSYFTSNFTSGASKIQSKIQQLNLPLDAAGLQIYQKKNGFNGIYTRQIDI